MAWRSTSPSITTATTGTTSVSLTLPSGAIAGDVLVAFIVDHANSGSQSAAATGWTAKGISPASANGRFQCFTAVIGKNGVSASGPWSFTGLTTRAAGVVLAFKGMSDDFANQPDVAASTRTNASGTTGTLGITPGNGGDMVVAGYCAFASGSTWSAEAVATAPVLTEHADGANSTFCSVAAASGVLAAAAPTGESSATMGTAGNNAGILISLKPMSKALSETVTATDVINKAPTAVLTTETVTATDTNAKGPSKAISETVTVSDNTIAKSALKALSETVTAGDTLTRSLVASRTFSETVAIADNTAKAPGKALTDIVSISDTTIKSTNKSLIDSLVIGDTLNRSSNLTLLETFTVNDTAIKSLIRSLSEIVSLADVLNRSLVATFNETAVLGDTETKFIGKSVAETVTLVDTVDRTITAIRNLNETVSLVDALARQSQKTLTDTISIADFVSRALVAIRTLIDEFSLSDTVTYSQGGGHHDYVQMLEETLSLLDILAKLVSATLSESCTVTDQITKAPVTTLSVETVSAADTIVKAPTKTVSENMGLSDVFSRVGTFLRTRAETIGLIDTNSKDLVRPLTIENAAMLDVLGKVSTKTQTESIIAADVLQRQSAKLLSEVLSLSDVVNRAGVFSRTIIESVGITDFANKQTTKPMTQESVSVSDVLLKSPSKRLQEEISLADVFSRIGNFVRLCAETLGISDRSSAPSSRPLVESVEFTNEEDGTVNLVFNPCFSDCLLLRKEVSSVYTDTFVIATLPALTEFYSDTTFDKDRTVCYYYWLVTADTKKLVSNYAVVNVNDLDSFLIAYAKYNHLLNPNKE